MPRPLHPRKTLWVVGLLGIAGLVDCAAISEMEEGVCGNSVVEPGEDCDRFPADRCIRPGESNQCRLHCMARADGARPACPTGWGCGTDDLCRQPNGSFAKASWLPVEGGAKLAAADFDGDRRADLAFVTPRELVVAYFGAQGEQSQSARWFCDSTAPVIGQLTSDDTLPDLILTVGGLTVLVGSADRSMQPTAYAPFSVGATSARVLVMEAMPIGSDPNDPVAWAGDEIIVLAGSQASNIGRTAEVDLLDMGQQMGKFAGDPLVGKLDSGWPCDHILLPFVGADVLPGYSPCSLDDASHVGWNKSEHGIAIRLPSGTVVSSPALLVDVDLDDYLDVVLGVVPAGTADVDAKKATAPVVAYGVGNGTFHSNRPSLEPPEWDGQGDGLTAPLPEIDTPGANRTGAPRMPLAVGDLNGDDIVDFVMPDAVLVSVKGWDGNAPATPVYGVFVEAGGTSWDQAVIADFNGNELPDVVVGSSEQAGITFLNGTSTGLFNEYWLPTRGYPTHFTVGDFDGDLLTDLAFAETQISRDEGGESADALSVCFGEGFGGPSVPVTMGFLGRIEQIAAGSMALFHLDDIDDLVVVSRPDDDVNSLVSVAALGGMSNRQMLSTFSLLSDISPTESLEMGPVLAEVGEFDGVADHADIAVMGARYLGDGNGGDLLSLETRLWLLPSSGRAAVDGGQDRPSEAFPYGFVGTQAALAPIDLDADGVDEVVVLGSIADQSSGFIKGRVFVARAEGVDGGDARAFRLDDLGPRDELYWQSISGLSLEAIAAQEKGDPNPMALVGRHRGSQVVAGNVMGDGRPELVALAYEVDFSSFELRTHLWLFQPDGLGGLDLSGAVNLTRDAVDNPTSFALVNLDGDEELELVMATEEHVLWADVDGSPLRKVRGVNGASGGYAVAVADFTGDGVVDLAVSQVGGIQMYRGKAVNP